MPTYRNENEKPEPSRLQNKTTDIQVILLLPSVGKDTDHLRTKRFYDVRYLGPRSHGRRRRALRSPGGTRNITYVHLAGHAAEDRTFRSTDWAVPKQQLPPAQNLCCGSFKKKPFK